jgi:hypothetical protein
MQSMSGVAHVPSAPLSGSTVVTGTGPSVMADGVSDASYLITNACNAPPTSPFPWPNPHSVPDHGLLPHRLGRAHPVLGRG